VSNKITRLFSEPLVQFLIIGACIYGAYSLFGAPEEDFRDTRVHVDSPVSTGLIHNGKAAGTGHLHVKKSMV
jgi:hypothetical protein